MDLSDMDQISVRRPEEHGTLIPKNDPTRTTKARLVTMSDVQPETIEWLWPGRIPLGKVTMIAGDPGLGKSLISLDLAARVSQGLDTPEGTPMPQGGVILLSGEDDPADTIVPRLMACGADRERIKILAAAVKNGHESVVNLARDPEVLADALEQVEDPKLLIIDPLSAFIQGIDSHKDADVRSALLPLQELAHRLHVAILLIAHLNKGSGRAAAYRVSGSLGFTALARCVHLVGKHREHPERVLLVPLKSNVGPAVSGLAYAIEPVQVQHKHLTIEAPKIRWSSGTVDVSADQLLSPDSYQIDSDEDDEVDLFLRGVFEECDQVGTREMQEQAREAGLSWTKVHRGLKEAKIRATPAGYQGQWVYPRPESWGVTESELSEAPTHSRRRPVSQDSENSVDSENSDLASS